MLLFSPFTEETCMNMNGHFHKYLMLQRSCKSLISRTNIGTTLCVNTELVTHTGNFLPMTKQGSTIFSSSAHDQGILASIVSMEL